jgi:hypothetical protein
MTLLEYTVYVRMQKHTKVLNLPGRGNSRVVFGRVQVTSLSSSFFPLVMLLSVSRLNLLLIYSLGASFFT